MTEDLHKLGHSTGVVLQGRLFRTLDDLERLSVSLGPDADVRICKGIYLNTQTLHTPGTMTLCEQLQLQSPRHWTLECMLVLLLMTTRDKFCNQIAR